MPARGSSGHFWKDLATSSDSENQFFEVGSEGALSQRDKGCGGRAEEATLSLSVFRRGRDR